MPRNVSGIYTVPVGTDGVANTTIFSAKYNTYIHDVETDLNTPRPIVAGGTGASDATTALKNMGGEIAGQVVTNYDTFVFQNGSFYSAVGATSAPNTTSQWTGIAVLVDANNIVLTATQVAASGTPLVRVREKVAGTWGAWVIPVDTSDKVSKAGDVMSGQLDISYASPAIVMTKAAGSGNSNTIYGQSLNNGARWALTLGDTGPESGSNVGSNFQLYRFSDTGGYIDNIFSIDRAAGTAIFGQSISAGGNVNANGSIVSGAAGASGVYYFGNTGARYFQWDGVSRYYLTGGTFVVANAGADFNGRTIMRATYPDYAYEMVETATGWIKGFRVNTVGTLEIVNNANSAVIAQLNDAGSFTAAGTVGAGNGGLVMGSTVPAAGFYGDGGNVALRTYGNNTIYFQNAGGSGTYGIIDLNGFSHTGGFYTKAGISSAAQSNRFNIGWTGTAAHLWIDASDFGQIAPVCDYRIKKDVIDLPGMWDTVKALRPIKYTRAEYSTPAHEEENAKRKAADPNFVEVPLFVADDIERWGFIAHELQDTMLPSAATGEQDQDDLIQSPDTLALIATLTKALQEAMARIEALEALP